ncbi:phosphotransferase [Ktedonospora formicarum]|nr:phosphotransferase [Ktedonospora formicarum]
MSLPLPPAVASYVGPLLSVETPPQGMAFKVFILTSQRGRFILKVAQTPAMIEALSREAYVLSALQDQAPLVAQPLMEEAGDGEHAFLFSYLEGEPLYKRLRRAESQERLDLVTQFAQTLRLIHNWSPDLSRPANWLSEKLDWLRGKIEARPVNTPIERTRTRFDGAIGNHLLDDLQARRPLLENDMVFGHYDYCLPNVLILHERVAGIIDWSGGGYIDRRFDLATALFSLSLLEKWEHSSYRLHFLKAYGYTEDPDSLSFFEDLHALTCAFWQ